MKKSNEFVAVQRAFARMIGLLEKPIEHLFGQNDVQRFGQEFSTFAFGQNVRSTFCCGVKIIEDPPERKIDEIRCGGAARRILHFTFLLESNRLAVDVRDALLNVVKLRPINLSFGNQERLGEDLADGRRGELKRLDSPV